MISKELKEYKAKWYLKNRERIRESQRNKTPEQRQRNCERAKEYYSKNREEILKQRKDYFLKYRLENVEKVKAQKKKYRDKNKKRLKDYNIKYEKENKYNNNYIKQRVQHDKCFHLSIILRKRLNMAVKNISKQGSAVKDLGCSIEYLKKHLESQFTEGMSWDNYGVKGWHIDHIIPLAYFDLTKEEDFKKACHYTNLQPLWAVDNMRKGASMVV